jgi:phage shock protein PspC (stress-responsive transcriptional regulator)
MTNPSLRDIRRRPAGRASISGLSQGIGHTFNLAPEVVRVVWLALYAVASGVPTAIADGVYMDGLIGWVYLFWLLTGGSPVVAFYMAAWAFTPNASGQRDTRPLLAWLLLLIVPLLVMGGLALMGSAAP